MTSRILVLSLLPAFAMALFGPIAVIGELGSSATITCHYRTITVNVRGRKFWCKMSQTSPRCETITSSTPFISPSYRNRISMSDFPKNGTFTVIMKELRWEDAGQYRCGIGQNNNGFFFPVNVNISEDSHEAGQPEVTFSEQRGSITIRCESQKNLTSTKTFWCRMSNEGCYTVVDSQGYVDTHYEGRIAITEDRDPGTFKVLMNHLMNEDTGWYRCGFETLGSRIILKDINLFVSEDTTLLKRPRLLQAVLGGSVSANCYQDLQGNFNLTYWCKWKAGACTLLIDSNGYVNGAFAERILMAPHSQDTGVYTVRMTELRADDAGWFWCGITDGIQEHTFSMRLRFLKVPSLLGSTLPTPATQTAPRSWSLSGSGDSSSHVGTISREKQQPARPSTLGLTTPSSRVIHRAGVSPNPNVGSTRLTSAPSWQYSRSTGMGLTLSVSENRTEPSFTVHDPSDCRKPTGDKPGKTISPEIHYFTDSTRSVLESQKAPRSAVPRMDSREHLSLSAHRSTTEGITVGPTIRHAASPGADTRGRTHSPPLWISKDLITAGREQEGAKPAERTLRSGPHLLSVVVPVLVLAMLLIAGLLLLVKLKKQKRRAWRPAGSPGTEIAMDEAKSFCEGTKEASMECREVQETDVNPEKGQLNDPEDSDSL